MSTAPLRQTRWPPSRPGCSSFIGAISRVGGNVLSVNQSLPQDGAADVTVTVRIADLSVEPARLPALLEQLDGVVGAAFIQ